VAVNPVTNKIYVITLASVPVTVIDGATNATTSVNAGSNPYALAVDAVTNRIYVANQASDDVTVIDGATNATVTLNAGDSPEAVAINPVTSKIYVANTYADSVTVIDGATNNTASIGVGTFPVGVAVNPVTNKIYVPNYNSNNVTVMDGTTGATTTVGAGSNPYGIAVNPVTNTIYVTNYFSSNVTVIDGAGNTTTTIPAGTYPVPIAVNPVTNKIYVANGGSNNVTVIDGATHATTTVSVGNSPYALAVNPITNKIYVANYLDNSVTVIDGDTNVPTTVTTGSHPNAVAVNPLTNKIYVAVDASVTVIDGATNATSSINTPWGSGGGPLSIAVNSNTNRIYIGSVNSNLVTVIDGANNTATSITAGESLALALNPSTNKIYVARVNDNNVTVIDGATNTTSTVSAGTNPSAVAANLVTGKIYVANRGSDNLTVITEQQVQPIPLTTNIAPLAGDILRLSLPPGPGPINFSQPPLFSFSFTASASDAPPVLNVYFQLDTLQGPWRKATGTWPNFIGSIFAPLHVGLHTVYAFAADGQFSDSIQTGTQSSPIPGAMAAYSFSVLATPTATAISLTAGTNPSTSGQSLTFQAAVKPASSHLAGLRVDFADGGNIFGSALADATGHASITTSGLSDGVHNITAIFRGEENFVSSISPVLTQAVMRTGPGSSSSITLTSTPQTYFRQSANFDVLVSGSGPPIGNVVLLEGNRQLGPLLTLTIGSPSSCSYQTPLPVGRHQVQAVYLGDASFGVNGSASAVQVVNTSPRPKPR
jgi:YVTN family beta-propeller protein